MNKWDLLVAAKTTSQLTDKQSLLFAIAAAHNKALATKQKKFIGEATARWGARWFGVHLPLDDAAKWLKNKQVSRSPFLTAAQRLVCV